MSVFKSSLMLLLLGSGLAWAQSPDSVPAAASTPAPAPSLSTEPQVSASPSTSKKYTVPTGTKVLLQFRSAVSTKSARPGDGVYLVSSFPVVVGNRVLIPAGVYVQGVVDKVERPIRIKGSAQLNMHFTSIIFPNGTVVDIPGLVNSLPGSTGPRVKDQEGTLQQTGNAGDTLGTAAKVGLSGAEVGTIGGAVGGSPLEGAGLGGAAGFILGSAVSLFMHGKDITLEPGAAIEMVLQRPLQLQQENLDLLPPENAVAPGWVPVPNQQRPLAKPSRQQILCPPGGLGCN